MLRSALIIGVAFGLYYFFLREQFAPLYYWILDIISNGSVAFILTYITVGIPMFVSILLLHPAREFMNALGLRKEVLRPMLAALVCTLPMFAGYGALSGFEVSMSYEQFLRGVLCAGFFEELYFRGFLFGQLFRKAKLGFIPAAIAGAIFFGITHLYQGNNAATTLGVFAVTFIGAGFFAWVYTEWGFNLWGSIFLHMFMNLSWTTFAIGDNAMGGVSANVFRAASIAFVIIGTILYKRRNQLPLTVTRNMLLTQRDELH